MLQQSFTGLATMSQCQNVCMSPDVSCHSVENIDAHFPLELLECSSHHVHSFKQNMITIILVPSMYQHFPNVPSLLCSDASKVCSVLPYAYTHKQTFSHVFLVIQVYNQWTCER